MRQRGVYSCIWRQLESPSKCSQRVDSVARAGAKAGSDDEIGSLEAGKLADLVILADDPRAVSPSSIGEIEVLETWLGGVRIH